MDIVRTLLFGGSSLDDSEEIARRGQVERFAPPAEVVRAVAPQSSSFWRYSSRNPVGVASDDPTKYQYPWYAPGSLQVVQTVDQGEVAAVLSRTHWRKPALEPTRDLRTPAPAPGLHRRPMPPHAPTHQQSGTAVALLPMRSTITDALPFDDIKSGRVEDGLRTVVDEIEDFMRRDPRYRGGTFDDLGLPDVSPWQYMGPLQQEPVPPAYVSAPLPPEAPVANVLPDATTQMSGVAGELVPLRAVVRQPEPDPTPAPVVKSPSGRAYVPMFDEAPREVPLQPAGQAVYVDALAARAARTAPTPQRRALGSGVPSRAVVRSVASLRADSPPSIN